MNLSGGKYGKSLTTFEMSLFEFNILNTLVRGKQQNSFEFMKLAKSMTSTRIDLNVKMSNSIITSIKQLHTSTCRLSYFKGYIAIIILIIIGNDFLSVYIGQSDQNASSHSRYIRRNNLIFSASSHIVLTKDDYSQSLVLTGEDGGGGKGKGKGGGGDQLVISGNDMGGDGQSSNMVMQDASNREGDVVINGNSMIIPGEDGHIVLSDSRRREGQAPPPRPFNPMMYWLPYMSGRYAYRMMPFFGPQFG